MRAFNMRVNNTNAAFVQSRARACACNNIILYIQICFSIYFPFLYKYTTNNNIIEKITYQHILKN